MGGYTPPAQREKWIWPKDTWLQWPKAGNTVLVQVMTDFWPEGIEGCLWGHMVTVPKRERPIWTRCPRKGEKDNSCPLCNTNTKFIASGGDKAKKPYPMRSLGWAIGRLVAIAESGVWKFYDPPQYGLIERGPEFWGKLSELEAKAAEPPSEVDPGKVVLPGHWTEWFVRATLKKDGAELAIYNNPKLELATLTQELEDKYAELFNHRIRVWDNLDKIANGESREVESEDEGEDDYTSFWKLARGMGFDPVEAFEILGVKDLKEVDLKQALYALGEYRDQHPLMQVTKVGDADFPF